MNKGTEKAEDLRRREIDVSVVTTSETGKETPDEINTCFFQETKISEDTNLSRTDY